VHARRTQHRGNTALHFAVAYGFAPLAEWLRRAGAQPGIRNAAGRAAADGIGPEGDF
jgi:ankyrin repeat protein